jgi:hypothetical protein
VRIAKFSPKKKHIFVEIELEKQIYPQFSLAKKTSTCENVPPQKKDASSNFQFKFFEFYFKFYQSFTFKIIKNKWQTQQQSFYVFQEWKKNAPIFWNGKSRMPVPTNAVEVMKSASEHVQKPTPTRHKQFCF